MFCLGLGVSVGFHVSGDGLTDRSDSRVQEERNSDIRDQLRGQVRAELERVAVTCKDFATLLRQLGVPVEGGTHPSEKQVRFICCENVKKLGCVLS